MCQIVDHIGRTWGTAHPLYLDMSRYKPDSEVGSGTHPIELLFENARQRKLLAIPVTGTQERRGPGDRYLKAVKRIAQEQKRGIGLRITYDDFHSPAIFRQILDETLALLSVEAQDVDLYLDAGPIARLVLGSAPIPTLVEKTGNAILLANAMRFRSIVFAGSSVPDSVGPRYNAHPCRVPRVELEAWRLLQSNKNIPSVRFGDYGVMPPLQSDSGGSRPPSRIRLSTPDEHVFYRSDPDAYLHLRSIVSKTPAMKAQSDSWGRRSLLGQGASGPGNASDWVARDTNASLETTCKDIVRHAGGRIKVPAIDLRRAGTGAWRQEGLDLPAQP